jgi:hypothetical protein
VIIAEKVELLAWVSRADFLKASTGIEGTFSECGLNGWLHLIAMDSGSSDLMFRAYANRSAGETSVEKSLEIKMREWYGTSPRCQKDAATTQTRALPFGA